MSDHVYLVSGMPSPAPRHTASSSTMSRLLYTHEFRRLSRTAQALVTPPSHCSAWRATCPRGLVGKHFTLFTIRGPETSKPEKFDKKRHRCTNQSSTALFVHTIQLLAPPCSNSHSKSPNTHGSTGVHASTIILPAASP